MSLYCIHPWKINMEPTKLYLPLFLLSPTFSEQRESGIVGTKVLEIKARDCTGEVVLVKSGNGQLCRGEIGNGAWEHRYACVYVHLYILIIHQHCHHQMLKSTLARQLQ